MCEIYTCQLNSVGLTPIAHHQRQCLSGDRDSPVFDLSANWLNNNACDWKSHTKPSILRHSVVDNTLCPGKNGPLKKML